MSSWSDIAPLYLAHISLISPLGASVELEVAAWFVGEGQLQDAAGHVYQGALLGGVPHGSGVYVRDGEVTLEATFGGGLAHGPGELRP